MPSTVAGPGPSADRDEAWMRRAVELADGVRGTTAPNPWVGAVLVTASGAVFEGATAPPGGPHAEVVALGRAAAAGEDVAGAALYTTLEPCAHVGRTGPCAPVIARAGVHRVVVGVLDPDPRVSGRGVAVLQRAGVDVAVGVGAVDVDEQLAAYCKHRRTGRPWVVLKLAATMDGRTAAPDGSSRWITGEEARRDVHRLRAVSDAVLVGAGTVRADDPELTVRTTPPPARQPMRVVLGAVAATARAQPAVSLSGAPGEVLDELGRRGVLQVLVEGGARVAHAFHAAELVDRYVLYLAPALFGGDDARPLFDGPGAGTIDGVWRGRLVSVTHLGDDLRVDLAPRARAA
ncbi:MAG: bifunctional diaminohydroxyphosphoribosylaminopyrimidine deaminase/5-amino-6-(5-phosphoribosylamino)uracil reductase RibD [Acidimicrobiales bacterium]